MVDWYRLRPKHPRIVAGAAVGIVVGVVVVLVALLTAGRHAGEEAAAQPSAVSGGTAVRDVQPRIVGGRPANISEVPFLASFGSSTAHACHGSLVDPQYLATTAECARVQWYTLTFLRTNLDDQDVGETRKIADFRIHPDWNPNDPRQPWAHNEAVVKLDRPVENIRPVCLAEKGSVFPTGAVATVYGYGRVGTSEALPAPRTLQSVNVTVADHDECKRAHRGKVTDDMICAGNDAGGQDICHGDGGAPLLVKVGDDHILLGSNIIGPQECGAPNFPAVYLNHDNAFLTDAIKQMKMSDPTPPPTPPPGPVCGIKNSAPPGGRLGNGQEVYPPHAYPWMAYVEESSRGQYMGGAVLINESFVLTEWASLGWFVVLGAHNLSSTTENTQRIEIVQVTKHPNASYMPWYGMDLARLSHPVTLTQNVKPVCLTADVLPPGSTCVLTGWVLNGHLCVPSRPSGDLLQEGSVTTITNQQCRDIALDWPWSCICKYDDDDYDDDRDIRGYLDYIKKDTFCAVSETHPTYCDWGSPLVCLDDNVWFLHGVLFYSGDSRPAIYYNIPYYLPWINSVMSQQLPAPTPEPSNGICFKKYEVGGRPANIAEVPFLASFGISTAHACHGSLVDPQYMATTAECARVQWYTVTFLRTNLDDQDVGETRKIADFRIHPDWNPNDPRQPWAHNEAVVKLDRPVENIRPVCLAEKGSVFPTGAVATVYGYGRVGTSEALPAPRTLQAVNVTVADHDECKRAHRGKVTDDMICAGNDAGGQDICHGDGGAPLLVKVGDDHILLGSNIIGPQECGAPNFPAVYVNHDNAFLTDAIKQMKMSDPTPPPPPTPPPGPVCGIKNSAPPGGRLVNGQDVSPPHAYPWMGYVEDRRGRYWGGAVLINESFVLTNWVWPRNYVVLGAHNLSSTTENTQRRKIVQVFRHPNSSSMPWDGMCLSRLSHPVTLTLNVKPVCLTGDVLAPGSTCVLTGWGKSRDARKHQTYTDTVPLGVPSRPSTDLLQEGSVTTITNQRCRDIWNGDDDDDDYDDDRDIRGYLDYITNDTFCAVSETHPTWWDWGSPLVCLDDNVWFLHGVLFHSFIYKYPAIYYNVPEFVPWINSVMSQQLPAPTPEPSNGICFKKYEG